MRVAIAGKKFRAKLERSTHSYSTTLTLDSQERHLLIYAHYYELASTGQLVQELAEAFLSQFKITVICVVPSYLGTVEDRYKTQKFYFENINGVDIIRIRVPEFSKKNKVSRIKNIVTYFIRAIKVTGKVKSVDYVMAISQPPVLGGMLGSYGKKKCHAKSNIIWLQDINPEQIIAVGYFKCKLLLWMLMKIDTYICAHADLVVVPGRDMVKTVQSRFTKRPAKMPRVTVINNWINEKEVYPLHPNHPKVVEFRKKYGLENRFIITYSGNLGNYYGLPELLKIIKKFPNGIRTRDGRNVAFTFVGDGTQKKSMEMYVRENSMDNVIFIPYQKKEDLIYSLNSADVHWCVNAKGIKGVSCPSKYYGIAAVGKPVLGVLEKGTEIRCIIEESRCGLCSDPEDYENIERNIRWFIENAGGDEMKTMGIRGREYLTKYLTKERSTEKYVKEILELKEGTLKEGRQR